MTFYSKKIENECATYEELSLTCSESYYCMILSSEKSIDVNILFDDKDVLLVYSPDDNNEIVYVILLPHVPVDVYILCSSIVSSICIHNNSRCLCRLFQLSTKTRVLTYLAWKVYEHTLESMRCMSGDNTTIEYKNRTYDENIRYIKSIGKDWESLDSKDKYGTIYRRKAGGIHSISTNISFKDISKHISELLT